MWILFLIIKAIFALIIIVGILITFASIAIYAMRGNQIDESDEL